MGCSSQFLVWLTQIPLSYTKFIHGTPSHGRRGSSCTNNNTFINTILLVEIQLQNYIPAQST